MSSQHDSKPTLVAFDFDGTITRIDTFKAFFKWAVGKRRYYGTLCRHFFVLVGFALGMVDGGRAKQALLTSFLKGMSLHDFTNIAHQFAETHRHLLRPEAIKAIDRHLEAGHTVVVVTASVEQWVAALLEERVPVIGTRLEVDENGVLTGRMDGANCRGAEKVQRLEEWLSSQGSEPLANHHLIVYGDSDGDNELFTVAQESHYKPFRS